MINPLDVTNVNTLKPWTFPSKATNKRLNWWFTHSSRLQQQLWFNPSLLLTCETQIWILKDIGFKWLWLCSPVARIWLANHRYIKGWLLDQTWHIMFTLNCLLATFHIRRWRRWCWRYYKQRCQMTEHSLSHTTDTWVHFLAIFVAIGTGYFHGKEGPLQPYLL